MINNLINTLTLTYTHIYYQVNFSIRTRYEKMSKNQ